jgi:hypothetical protein
MPSDCGLEGVVLILCIPKIMHMGAPWERMAIDILRPLSRTDNGNKYIMVVGDYFTKWMEAFPIPDAEAKTVADKFVEKIASIFDVPLQMPFS